MRFFRFDRAAGTPYKALRSKNTMLNRVAEIKGEAQVDVLHMGPRADIEPHKAGVPQLLMVVQGAGYVQAGTTRRAINAGQAVFWDEGEEYEIGSDYGLIALVIESKALDPEDLLVPLG